MNFSTAAISENEKRIRLKQWLLAGLEISDDDPHGQHRHVHETDVIRFPAKTEHEVDAEMARLVTGVA